MELEIIRREVVSEDPTVLAKRSLHQAAFRAGGPPRGPAEISTLWISHIRLNPLIREFRVSARHCLVEYTTFAIDPLSLHAIILVAVDGLRHGLWQKSLAWPTAWLAARPTARPAAWPEAYRLLPALLSRRRPYHLCAFPAHVLLPVHLLCVW